MAEPQGGRAPKRRLRLAQRLASTVLATVPAVLLSVLPAGAQTMTEAMAYAYSNNPQLLAQRAALRAADEGVPQALSGWRPTVNFSAAAGYDRAGIKLPGTPTVFSS